VVAHDIELVGIDYLSIESFDDHEHGTHRTLLGHGVLVIEGLNLAEVAPGPYLLLCLPLALAAGDGAPARVLLVER
ncbi:MAG: cyclase family protein, partial [Chloroflexia bacterium]|nr:cyclase family protein [Chloroflexia bacterium]